MEIACVVENVQVESWCFDAIGLMESLLVFLRDLCTSNYLDAATPRGIKGHEGYR